MMIDSKISDDPKYSAATQEFTTTVRMYWRRNVGRHFNLRSSYWNLARKMNHRISISTGGDKTLSNALEINWNPDAGHVTVRPGKLMVKGGSRPYNLIDILVYGTRKTPKAYVVEIDKRVPSGERGAQSNDQWIRWMNVFVPYVDKQLEIFTERIAHLIADSLEDEVPFGVDEF